jgi:hypothetical protein
LWGYKLLKKELHVIWDHHRASLDRLNLWLLEHLLRLLKLLFSFVVELLTDLFLDELVLGAALFLFRLEFFFVNAAPFFGTVFMVVVGLIDYVNIEVLILAIYLIICEGKLFVLGVVHVLEVLLLHHVFVEILFMIYQG